MAENETEFAGGKSKGNMVVTVLLIVNLGLSGVTVMQVMKMPKPHIVQVQLKGQGGKEDAPGVPSKPKPTFPLETFVVNLNEPGKPRYLKTTFTFELEDEDTKAVIDARKGAVRDDILRYLSSLSVSDCLGEEGKIKVQKELVKRAEKVIGTDTIRRVLLGDFIIN